MIFRPEFEADIADRFDSDGKFRSKTRRAAARAAGSMTSTADDLARFASALFAGTIVKPATRREMLHDLFRTPPGLHDHPHQ
jgi:CubicO group peptidase (beta-lactamase class C family)